MPPIHWRLLAFREARRLLLDLMPLGAPTLLLGAPVLAKPFAGREKELSPFPAAECCDSQYVIRTSSLPQALRMAQYPKRWGIAATMLVSAG